MVTDKTGWLCMESLGEDNTGMDKYERQRDLKYHVHAHTQKARSMRSQSAPPFYREKKRFISLNNHSMKERGVGEMKLTYKASGMCDVQHAKPNLPGVLLPNLRSAMKKEDVRQDVNDIHTDDKLEQSTFLQFNDTAPLQDNSDFRLLYSVLGLMNTHSEHRGWVM